MAAASSYCAASPVAPTRSRVPTSPSAPKSNAFLSIGGGSAASAFAKGGALRGCGCLAVFPPVSKRLLPVRSQAAEAEVETGPERFRLNNLSPQPGSRKRNKRKGRGISAGQGASCGFGMRGQRSRSGAGVRRGFEGGQMPLYRRIPKLKGIAGGMKKGIPKFVTVNLADIAAANFSDGEEVSLESLKSKRILNPTGKDGKLRLKILGDGELTGKLTVKAGAFSESAKSKLEAAGIAMVDVPGRKKWVKPSVAKHQQRAVDYFAQKRASDSWVEK